MRRYQSKTPKNNVQRKSILNFNPVRPNLIFNSNVIVGVLYAIEIHIEVVSLQVSETKFELVVLDGSEIRSLAFLLEDKPCKIILHGT